MPSALAMTLSLSLLACKDGGVDSALPTPPDVAPPDALGAWAVGHLSDTLLDVGEPGRALPVDLWYPVTPGDERGFEAAEYLLQDPIGLSSEVAFEGAPGASIGAPLLVFSHGYQSINTQSTSLMETLASHGFFVVAPAHTGNTQDTPNEDFELAASRRVPDVAAVIDWVRDGEAAAAGQVDPTTLGVLGHSFGGMTTLGVGAGWAGAAAIDGVAALMPISAVVDADLQADDRPSPSAGFSERELAAITQPTLLLGGTEDQSVPVENNALAFDWMSGAASVHRVDIIGANHTHFANVCDIGELLIELGVDVEGWPALGAGDLVEPYTKTCTGEAFPIDEAIRLQNLYAVAFFRLHLLGEADYGWWLTPEAAGLEADVSLWVR